jgi:HEAT repeat protein
MADAEPASPRNGAAVATAQRREEIQKHIKGLMSADFAVRAASIGSLQKFGSDAAEALVDTLMRKPGEPHALTNVSDALAEIGRPSLQVVLHALSHIAEIRREEDVYLVDQLAELAVRQNDRKVAQPLFAQLSKLDAALKRGVSPALANCCEAAKVRIHRILADLGEKGGLEDLLRMLADGRRRVRDGVVAALARIGDRRALVPLVRLYDIEEHVSSSGAQDVKEAVREICRRERAGAEDRAFADLAATERASLERMLGKAAPLRH